MASIYDYRLEIIKGDTSLDDIVNFIREEAKKGNKEADFFLKKGSTDKNENSLTIETRGHFSMDDLFISISKNFKETVFQYASFCEAGPQSEMRIIYKGEEVIGIYSNEYLEELLKEKGIILESDLIASIFQKAIKRR